MYSYEYLVPQLIKDEDIIFHKESEYHKQHKKEKKNPIFKERKHRIKQYGYK